MEPEFCVTLPSNSSTQYFPDNKTSNFVTKLSRTLQLDGEWEVGLAEIDYPHTWYNIREGKNSVEIYVPDKWAQEGSIQPGYYEKVIDVIDVLRKAGLANLTDVVVTHDDTSKRVTVKTRSHDPFLRIRFLAPNTGSKRSDGPISRFRFCGENVERSFVVCSHDPFFQN